MLRRFGVDVTRYPGQQLEYRRICLLRHYGVTVVLDVGAARGEYGEELRSLGYKGRIVSFEPLTSSFNSLRDKAARDLDWIVVRAAVGDAPGTATLNVAQNRNSSSLLPMMPQHVDAAPSSLYVGTEEVPVVRLDTAAYSHLAEKDRAFIKIDVQGYTRQVLMGAEGLLARTVGIQVELSLAPLYEGELLFREGLEELARYGFTLMGVEPGFAHPVSGRTLQVDAVFFRE